MSDPSAMFEFFLARILADIGAVQEAAHEGAISITGEGSLPAWFAVSELANATIGAAGLMLARYAMEHAAALPEIVVNRRLASLWFAGTIRPLGWKMPPAWDALAGDYRARDGWIKLHTNAPHHRKAALSVLGNLRDRDAVAAAVARWNAVDLETAIVDANGCAAAMLDVDAWATHPQGIAVAGEPLVHWQDFPVAPAPATQICVERPLAGLKILDLTRVLAGPVAGRFLAAYGAQVLRLDPPHWNEPGVVPEVTLGKRCARLDLKTAEGRRTFAALLPEADLLLHGYRPNALDRLGFGRDVLRKYNPGLVDVSLNAYGWTGPWRERRGFDSLVQMSCGIADYGMRLSHVEQPVPLPVQALDMATGYLMAAAALHALCERRRLGRVLSARLSLARTASLLLSSRRSSLAAGMEDTQAGDIDPRIEDTAWGPARRVRFPLRVAGILPAWEIPARDLRWCEPHWGEYDARPAD